jgi:hypothetical protein
VSGRRGPYEPPRSAGTSHVATKMDDVCPCLEIRCFPRLVSDPDFSSRQRRDSIDVVIPLGSNALVSSIQNSTRIPVMGHADGRCCAYVHSDANLALARDVMLDSKIDYPAACNALETLLVHESMLADGIMEVVSGLVEKEVELRCEDDILRALDGVQGAVRATDEDIVTEFLDLKIYIRSVKSVDEGLPTPPFLPHFLVVLQPSIISIRTHLTIPTQY